MKMHEMDDSAGQNPPASRTIAAYLRVASTQRNCLIAAHVAWFKAGNHSMIAPEPTLNAISIEKRNKRVGFALTDAQYAALVRLAIEDRRDPGEMAWVIVADFLDGKLAPVAPQPEEAA